MYNEEETIGTVVTMTKDFVDEVICVDDGSSDSSARIAESCGAIVHRHRVNRGYGGALKSLFQVLGEKDVDILVIPIATVNTILKVYLPNSTHH